MSTTEYLDTLTLDQLRFARDYATEKIRKAEEQPRRTVWVVSNGIVNLAWFREAEADKAADRLLAIFKERFLEETGHFLDKPYGTTRFAEHIPQIYAHRCTQLEYDNEWFPESEVHHD